MVLTHSFTKGICHRKGGGPTFFDALARSLLTTGLHPGDSGEIQDFENSRWAD